MNAETIDQQPIQGPERASVITFPAYKLDRFHSKVDSANRRLEKAGSDARFEFILEEFFAKKAIGGLRNEEIGTWIIEPTWVDVPWIAATQASELNLTIGDYTFLAALVAEEAGVTVHTAPGHELGGFEPAGDLHCDHCNIDRDRIRLYLVRENETGRILQLGHSCIELFTGFSPKGLFALQFDEELRELGNDDEVGGFNQRDFAAGVDQVIALAWAYSNEGRAYVSAKAAFDDRVSTGSEVKMHLFTTLKRSNYASGWTGDVDFQAALERRAAKAELAAATLANAELLEAIKAVATTLASDSDYGRNMAVILNGERVSHRNIGILASLVAIYAREQELAIKRANAVPAAQGFLAEVGTRIKANIELTISQARQREGDYGWTTWIVGSTASGHVVVWNASRAIDLEPGDVLVLSAATVKAHEQYKGVDQTVITRAKVAE
jgi:hypothetical protein